MRWGENNKWKEQSSGSSDSGSDYFLKRSGPNSDLNPILKTFHNSIHYYSENIHDSG